MTSAKRVRLYVRIVDATSIPLAVVMLLYLISGYGMISSALQAPGLDHVFWARIHNSPILRIVTVGLTALHGYCGMVVLACKHLKSPKARLAAEVTLLALTLAFCALIAYAELYTVESFRRFRRGWQRP